MFSKHAIWNRGSSQNPNGRFERLSVLAWEHGGFADATPSIVDFATHVRSDPALLKQFKAAATVASSEARSHQRARARNTGARRCQRKPRRKHGELLGRRPRLDSSLRTGNALWAAKTMSASAGRLKAELLHICLSNVAVVTDGARNMKGAWELLRRDPDLGGLQIRAQSERSGEDA